MTLRAQTQMDYASAYDFLIELEGDFRGINKRGVPEYRGLEQRWYEKMVYCGNLVSGDFLESPHTFPKSILEMTEWEHNEIVHRYYWVELLIKSGKIIEESAEQIRGPTDLGTHKGFVMRYNDECKTLLQGIMAPLFFMGVNCGPEDAIRLAQRTSPFLKEDGILGAKTYSFLHSISEDKVLEWWDSGVYHINYRFECQKKYSGHPQEPGLLARLEKIGVWLRKEVP